MCMKTAATIFQEAVTRARALEAPIRTVKSAGTGRGQVLAKQLQQTGASIKEEIGNAEKLRFLSPADAQGPNKGSRAKKLHESGLKVACHCDHAEQLLEVCSAQMSIQVSKLVAAPCMHLFLYVFSFIFSAILFSCHVHLYIHACMHACVFRGLSTR